jgi:hypothetical protein
MVSETHPVSGISLRYLNIVVSRNCLEKGSGRLSLTGVVRVALK